MVKTLSLFGWAIWVVGLAVVRGPAAEIVADFAATNGPLRPLHGVNLGPLCYRGTVDLSAYHRALAVPYTRLHDVVWLHADAVDVSTIFRDFRDDPAQPENYTFAPTDDYLQAIVAVGSKIVYRLGESIEHTPRKYRVHPPGDPARWAQICLGIIRHYNEGWAQGFRHDIRYWEIWNEPDVRPAMWTGTDAQFFQLYETAATAIKARFPELQVGGPALGNVGSFVGDTFRPAAFFTNFLAHCRARNVPLDFFSWHRYTAQPADFARLAHAVRRVLNDFGFVRTESHLNEWNYLPNNDWRPMLQEGQGASRAEWYEQMGGAEGAAFIAWAFISLQDAPVDVANFYTGEIQGFGLFNIHGVPKKTFYAFKAFRGLLDTPLRVTVREPAGGSVAALAGVRADRQGAAVLLSNFRSPERRVNLTCEHLPWQGTTRFEFLVVDAAHDLVMVREGQVEPGSAALTLELPAPAVGWLILRPVE